MAKLGTKLMLTMAKSLCLKHNAGKDISNLDGFATSIDADGKWLSKIQDGKIIVHSSMYFADKPFELQDKAPVAQQDTNDNIALQSQN